MDVVWNAFFLGKRIGIWFISVYVLWVKVFGFSWICAWIL